jgi:hypothetical protein
MTTQAGYSTSSGVAYDFFRTSVTDALPDGTNDPTDFIYRAGRTGFGEYFDTSPNSPVAVVDIAAFSRTGTSPLAAAASLYATSASMTSLPGPGFTAHTVVAPVVAFGHSSQLAGVAVAQNGLYTYGNNSNFRFWNSGGTSFAFGWSSSSLTARDIDYCSPTPDQANNQYSHRYFAQNASMGIFRIQTEKVGFSRFVWYVAGGGSTHLAMRVGPLSDGVSTSVQVGENQVHNRKLVLHTVGTSDTSAIDTEFMGFGVDFGAIALRYNTLAASSHRFYSGAVLNFEIKSDGGIWARALTVAASDAAAGTAGVVSGELYKDSAGVVSQKS